MTLTLHIYADGPDRFRALSDALGRLAGLAMCEHDHAAGPLSGKGPLLDPSPRQGFLRETDPALVLSEKDGHGLKVARAWLKD